MFLFLRLGGMGKMYISPRAILQLNDSRPGPTRAHNYIIMFTKICDNLMFYAYYHTYYRPLNYWPAEEISRELENETAGIRRRQNVNRFRYISSQTNV